MKKALIWLVVLVVIAGAIGGWLWFKQRSRMNTTAVDILRSAEIEKGNLDISVPASGTVVSHRSSDLHFALPGKVSYINVEVGDTVSEGQILAGVDSRNLERAVKIAEIALEQAELNLATLLKTSDEHDIELAEYSIKEAQQALSVSTLNRELAAAQAALSNRIAREIRDDIRQAYLEFQKTLERYNLPYAYGAGVNAANMEAEGNVGVTALKGNFNIQQAESSWWATYSALQQSEKTLSDLIDNIDSNRIEQTELQIEQAQLNVDQARQRLGESVIIAPYNGTVAAINITEGLAAPFGSPNKKPAIVILDNYTQFTDVSIDEIDIGKVQTGQLVEIVLDAYSDVTLPGVVKEIEEVPSNITGIISYKVRISIEDKMSTQPRDGMTASVFIKTRTVEDIILIPNWAIRTDQTTSETYVYCHCLVEGTPQRTIIETGVRNDSFTQVISGLEEGSIVALIAEERNLFDFDGPPQSFGQ